MCILNLPWLPSTCPVFWYNKTLNGILGAKIVTVLIDRNEIIIIINIHHAVVLFVCLFVLLFVFCPFCPLMVSVKCQPLKVKKVKKALSSSHSSCVWQSVQAYVTSWTRLEWLWAGVHFVLSHLFSVNKYGGAPEELKLEAKKKSSCCINMDFFFFLMYV